MRAGEYDRANHRDQVCRARDRVVVTRHPPTDVLQASASASTAAAPGVVVRSVGGVSGASGEEYALGDMAMATSVFGWPLKDGGGVGSSGMGMGAEAGATPEARATAIEREMLARLRIPGRFSDATLRRVLYAGMPQTLRLPEATCANLSAARLPQALLDAVRRWYGELTLAAAEDSPIEPPPEKLLDLLIETWLRTIGACELMGTAELLGLSLLARPFVMQPYCEGKGLLPQESAPLVLLANRLALPMPIGSNASIGVAAPSFLDLDQDEGLALQAHAQADMASDMDTNSTANGSDLTFAQQAKQFGRSLDKVPGNVTARNDHAVRVSLFGGPVPTGAPTGLFAMGSLVAQLATSMDFVMTDGGGRKGMMDQRPDPKESVDAALFPT